MKLDSGANVIEGAIRRLLLDGEDAHTARLIHPVKGMLYVLQASAG
ncbi:hypothetical protein SJI00_03240 [Pseudomonas sp. RP23018S]|nr:hypothetical protein [Pseudomonas sp. RP23018S]MDZ5601793.1 hypothetical protein [Pseudomonas sp. RP23018S]